MLTQVLLLAKRLECNEDGVFCSWFVPHREHGRCPISCAVCCRKKVLLVFSDVSSIKFFITVYFMHVLSTKAIICNQQNQSVTVVTLTEISQQILLPK
jgi:hypothetical protein